MQNKSYFKGTHTQRTMTQNGYMQTDARLARHGIYHYSGAEIGLSSAEEDKIYNVFVAKKDILKPERRKTFANLPVTFDHPHEFLDADNTSDHIVGYSGDEVWVDEDGFIASRLTITDSDCIQYLDQYEVTISVGSWCDYEEKSGTSPDGQAYDYVKKNILGNHIALVPIDKQARAGDQCKVLDTTTKEEKTMADKKEEKKEASFDADSFKKEIYDYIDEKFKAKDSEEEKKEAKDNDNDKKEVKAKDKSKDNDDDKKEAKDAVQVIDKLQAKIDELESRSQSVDTKILISAVKEMQQVMDVAANFGVSSDNKDLQDLKLEILKSANPQFDFTGKSMDYINARFDVLKSQQNNGAYIMNQIHKATSTDNVVDVYEKDAQRKKEAWRK